MIVLIFSHMNGRKIILSFLSKKYWSNIRQVYTTSKYKYFLLGFMFRQKNDW